MTSCAPRLKQELDRRAERAAGREHRVEHEALAIAQVVGQPLGVGRRLEGLLVAHHAEEADLGGRQQLDHALQHPESGAQDRHHERSRLADANAAVVVATGVRISTRLGAHVARRLVGEQRHELLGELAGTRATACARRAAP